MRFGFYRIRSYKGTTLGRKAMWRGRNQPNTPRLPDRRRDDMGTRFTAYGHKKRWNTGNSTRKKTHTPNYARVATSKAGDVKAGRRDIISRLL